MATINAKDSYVRKEKLFTAILYVSAFMLPVCVMTVILRDGGFYPFGNRTLFIMDMRDQYLEFFAHLRYLSGGDDSLFFCWSRSMGGNFLGLYAYYLASPLSFLTCLFPLEHLDAAIVLLTLLKIGLCGLSFALYGNYLRKRAAETVISSGAAASPFIVLLFSLCYALPAYNMVYSMCLMWLDGVILLPAVLLGVEKLLDGKRGLHYTLSLTALFLCNYYTGYMAGIFTGIYFLYRAVGAARKGALRDSFAVCARFGVCTFLSLGLSAPLLLPVAKDLARGKLSEGGSPFSLTANFPLEALLAKFGNGSYDSITYSGLPTVYCGTIILILGALFFLCRRISLREKIGAALILTFFILSFYLKGLNLIWHGFRTPVWFPFRYAFLFSFFLIYMALRTALAICRRSCPAGSMRRAFPKTFLFLTIFILTVFDLKSNAQALISGLNSQFGYADRGQYLAFLNGTKPLADLIREQNDGLYRVNAAFEYSKNDAMLLGYNGMTHYSSTYNAAVNSLTRQLGIAQSHIWNSGYGSCPLTDSLFAVSYRLSDRSEPEFYEEIASGANGRKLFRNNAALPMVYAADILGQNTSRPENSGGDIPLNLQKDPYANRNLLLNTVAGKDELYFREEIYAFSSEKDGWSYTLTSRTADPLYLYMPAQSNLSADIFVNDVFRSRYFTSETSCSLYIGTFAPGEEVRVSVKCPDSYTAANRAIIASLDTELLTRTLEELRSGSMEITSHGGGTLSGTITLREGQMIMTSIPWDEGWSVRSDGQKAETKCFAGTFLALEAPPGEHSLSFSYVSPGFREGLCIFSLSVLAAVFFFCRGGSKTLYSTTVFGSASR